MRHPVPTSSSPPGPSGTARLAHAARGLPCALRLPCPRPAPPPAAQPPLRASPCPAPPPPPPPLPPSPPLPQGQQQHQQARQHQPPGPPLELTFLVPQDSAASELLRTDPLAVLITATAEEAALLAQLSARLQAGSILAAGLVLTATQHDTCIAKLGLMQAAAVLAAASSPFRYVASIRRRSGGIGGGITRTNGTDSGSGSSSGSSSSSSAAGGESKNSGNCGGSDGDPAPRSGAAASVAEVRQEDPAAGVWRSLSLRRLGAPDADGPPAGSIIECSWATGPLTAVPPALTPNVEGATSEEVGRAGAPLAPPGVPAAPAPPVGVWTSLRLDQLPRAAAHWVRLAALRRALQRLGARDAAVAPGALDHHSRCDGCRRWRRALATALAAGAAVALCGAAALLVALLGAGPWAAWTAGPGGSAASPSVAGA